MRSTNTWGKVVEGVLIRGRIGCSQSFTGVGMFVSWRVWISGNAQVIRFFTVVFPNVFTQLKVSSSNLLTSWFSLFSTPPIISETN